MKLLGWKVNKASFIDPGLASEVGHGDGISCPHPFESSRLALPVPGSPNSSSGTLIREEVSKRLGKAGTQTLCPLETDVSVIGHTQRLWY